MLLFYKILQGNYRGNLCPHIVSNVGPNIWEKAGRNVRRVETSGNLPNSGGGGGGGGDIKSKTVTKVFSSFICTDR